MLAVVLGAASAVFFGAGDFIGGFASKRITAMLVTGIAALAGVVALTIAAPFDGGIWYAETWIGGIGTGITSCLGICASAPTGSSRPGSCSPSSRSRGWRSPEIVVVTPAASPAPPRQA